VDPTNNSSGNVITSTATIVVNGPEAVTCTFSNSQIIPSAGPVSVEGRVTDAYGRPIRGAVLTLIRTSDNSVRYTYTNTF
ncbi:carboxypeptidase-like regulatory domain-containing protein, partial [Escherichia coli]|nr:carboxypeptidase-like regulatory domain-containing protein [Escherichia coli]